jgi:DNA-binding transcriptional regulator PaaX
MTGKRLRMTADSDNVRMVVVDYMTTTMCPVHLCWHHQHQQSDYHSDLNKLSHHCLRVLRSKTQFSVTVCLLRYIEQLGWHELENAACSYILVDG